MAHLSDGEANAGGRAGSAPYEQFQLPVTVDEPL